MAKKPLPAKDGFNEILLYTTSNGNVKVEIYLQNETIWLTQQKIAVLFGVQRPAVTKHLKNIFESGELNEASVSSILEHTATDQKKYQTTFYNLDAIISVGYRVNSTQATAFRIWATERLKEYIIKGFTMDDERLKNPNNIFGHDYFEEQLARIRDIRVSKAINFDQTNSFPAITGATVTLSDDAGNSEILTETSILSIDGGGIR